MAGSLQLGSGGPSQQSLSTGMINDPDSPHIIMPPSSSSSVAAGNNYSHLAGGRQHTKHPYVTGSSIVGMRCVDGIVLASDTMGKFFLSSLFWLGRGWRVWMGLGLWNIRRIEIDRGKGLLKRRDSVFVIGI